MKTNHLLLLLILIVLPIEPVSAWWWTSNKSAIEACCQKASEAEQKVDREKKSSKESMKALVNLFRTIDLQSCPADFQAAFLDYIHAYDATIPYYSKYEGFTGALVGAVELLTTMHDKSSEEGSKLIKEILDKRAVVENIANKYGAKIRPLPPDDITQKAYLSQ